MTGSADSLPLQSKIIYGPVRSRRLGSSLGINLLPAGYKLCSFNCLYCQYGRTLKPTFSPTYQLQDMPKPELVAAELELALRRLLRDELSIDSITISGNGEPTLYPQLAVVIDSAKRLRDRYLPRARIAILSNSSTVGMPHVRASLDGLDLKIMKLDAGTEELFRRLNHPASSISLGKVVAGLKQLRKVILQSLFVQGRVTNSDADAVAAWVEKVAEIQPLSVQVYTLDRAPADKRIQRVGRSTLEWIAAQVRSRAGAPADVF